MSDFLPQTHITGLDVVAGGSTVTGSESDNYLLIPLTSIPELEEDECDEATGDIRCIAFAFSELLYQVYQAMATADRPTKWRSSRSPGTPDADGKRTAYYTNTFSVEDTETEVEDES